MADSSPPVSTGWAFFDIDNDEDKTVKLQKTRKVVQVLGIICGCLLFASGLYSLTRSGKCSNLIYLVSFYLALFGAVVVPAELRLKKVRMFALFLRYRTGRAGFYIFIGSLSVFLDNVFSIAVGIYAFVVGILTAILALAMKKVKEPKGQQHQPLVEQDAEAQRGASDWPGQSDARSQPARPPAPQQQSARTVVEKTLTDAAVSFAAESLRGPAQAPSTPSRDSRSPDPRGRDSAPAPMRDELSTQQPPRRFRRD
eukprot:Colp12_sorted_trinity150504_noHs@19815